MITKNKTVVAASGALVLAGLITLQLQAVRGTQDEASRSSATKENESVGNARKTVDTSKGASDAVVALKPTRDEEVVLTMYERMATALEQHTNDCEAMGLAVEEVVATHSKQVTRVMAARAKLNDPEKQAAQTRLEAAAQSRMARVREGLRTGLTSCGTDERLQAALRTLADLNTPS